MGQSDLNAVRVFVEVVAVRSFRGAARRLGLPKSTVSRKVAELEEALGAQLLNRTTRQVEPTEIGRAYHRQAAQAVVAIDEAARAVDELQAEPRGLLRLSVPVTFGELFMGQILAPFLARHPGVEVQVDLSDRAVDIVAEGFDAVIRAGALVDSSLIARRLGQSPLRTFASPAYLAAHGVPRRPEELSRHACLVFGSSAAHAIWSYRRGRRTVRVQVNARASAGSFLLVRDLAEAGLGVARLPSFLGESSKRLRPILDTFVPPSTPMHIVYPATRNVSAKLRAFLDHLDAQLETAPWATPAGR